MSLKCLLSVRNFFHTQLMRKEELSEKTWQEETTKSIVFCVFLKFSLVLLLK
jgi:hypothetical protein